MGERCPECTGNRPLPNANAGDEAPRTKSMHTADMSENAPTQPVPPTPPGPPGAHTPPPPPPHRPPHHDGRPWYREVWFIVTASVVAAILVFGAGFVSGGILGFVAGKHHGNKSDRTIEMRMWGDGEMPWFDGDQSERGQSQRGRGGFGGNSDSQRSPWGMSPDTAPNATPEAVPQG